MYTPALILVALAVPLMVLARPTINIYSSIAAKFELVPSDGPVMKAVRSETVVTSGVLTATSYLNTTTCAGNPYAIEWVTLGYCGVYHANASDPAAPSLGCGNFVYTSAYTSTATGYEQLYLDFNFYKDGACTVAGTPDSGGSCTRSVAINTTCTDHSVEGMTSSLIGAIETNFMLPEFGYTRMTHNKSTCMDTAYSGLWESVGCSAMSDSSSIYASCPGTTYNYGVYANAICDGTPNFSESVPLVECEEDVFNEDDDAGVTYGMGYTMSVCTQGTPTAEPSAEPTAAPSNPTAVPTLRPTHKPTVYATAPTMKPTKNPSPVLTFTSNVTLSGITSPTLNANSQEQIVYATANAMGVSISDVMFVAAYLMPGGVNPFALHYTLSDDEVSSSTGKHLRLQDERDHGKAALDTYSFIVVTRTTINVDGSGYSTAEELYQALTVAFAGAVTGGTYADQLHESGIAELASAVATDPVSSPASVTNPSSDNGGGKNGLSKGALVGIIVGVIGGVLLICGTFFWYVKGHEDRVATREHPTPTPQTRAATGTTTQENPVLSGARGVGTVRDIDL